MSRTRQDTTWELSFKRKLFYFLFGIFVILLYITTTTTIVKKKFFLAPATSSDITRNNPFFVEEFHCHDLVANASSKYDNKTKYTRMHDPESLLNDKNCEVIKKDFSFPTTPLTAEEQNFPLAFVMIVYNNIQQFFQLFQSLYWPQNLYCITYDNKSTPLTKKIVHLLASCFDNVILSENHIRIDWGKSSVLQAPINCFKVMHQSPYPWKYVQIIAWNDFPLKTNAEMVQILKIFDGQNDLELAMGNRERQQSKGTPPGNLTIFKGSFAATMSREFVSFSLQNQIAVGLLDWMQDTLHPDEHYWPTLNFNINLSAPGSYPGRCYLENAKQFRRLYISRYQVWTGKGCHGKMFRGSCVFGLKDLPYLVTRPHLVAHKIYMDYEPAVWYCLKEWLHNKTYGLSPNVHSLNFSFYKNMPTVKYKVMKYNYNCE